MQSVGSVVFRNARLPLGVLGAAALEDLQTYFPDQLRQAFGRQHSCASSGGDMNLKEALKLLDLTVECTPADTKAAYKKKALEYHPDRNDSADANEKFQSIGAAYARVCLFHEGGGHGGDADDGTAPSRDSEIEAMLFELFGDRLSKSAAAAIASTLGVGRKPPIPPPPKWDGRPTNPTLAEKIAATRAAEKAARLAAHEAAREAAAAATEEAAAAATDEAAAAATEEALPPPLPPPPPPPPAEPTRLLDLPDSILISILSLTPSVSDAARAAASHRALWGLATSGLLWLSVLSERWPSVADRVGALPSAWGLPDARSLLEAVELYIGPWIADCGCWVMLSDFPWCQLVRLTISEPPSSASARSEPVADGDEAKVSAASSSSDTPPSSERASPIRGLVGTGIRLQLRGIGRAAALAIEAEQQPCVRLSFRSSPTGIRPVASAVGRACELQTNIQTLSVDGKFDMRASASSPAHHAPPSTTPRPPPALLRRPDRH